MVYVVSTQKRYNYSFGDGDLCGHRVYYNHLSMIHYLVPAARIYFLHITRTVSPIADPWMSIIVNSMDIYNYPNAEIRLTHLIANFLTVTPRVKTHFIRICDPINEL